MLGNVLLLFCVKCVYVYVQNQELIDASGAGDVVRVTSLLNSGADPGGKVHESNNSYVEAYIFWYQK